jgi:hypothetical protein
MESRSGFVQQTDLGLLLSRLIACEIRWNSARQRKILWSVTCMQLLHSHWKCLIALFQQYFYPMKQGPGTIEIRVFRFDGFRYDRLGAGSSSSIHNNKYCRLKRPNLEIEGLAWLNIVCQGRRLDKYMDKNGKCLLSSILFMTHLRFSTPCFLLPLWYCRRVKVRTSLMFSLSNNLHIEILFLGAAPVSFGHVFWQE